MRRRKWNALAEVAAVEEDGVEAKLRDFGKFGRESNCFFLRRRRHSQNEKEEIASVTSRRSRVKVSQHGDIVHVRRTIRCKEE